MKYQNISKTALILSDASYHKYSNEADIWPHHVYLTGFRGCFSITLIKLESGGISYNDQVLLH